MCGERGHIWPKRKAFGANGPRGASEAQMAAGMTPQDAFRIKLLKRKESRLATSFPARHTKRPEG